MACCCLFWPVLPGTLKHFTSSTSFSLTRHTRTHLSSPLLTIISTPVHIRQLIASSWDFNLWRQRNCSFLRSRIEIVPCLYPTTTNGSFGWVVNWVTALLLSEQRANSPLDVVYLKILPLTSPLISQFSSEIGCSSSLSQPMQVTELLS